MEQSSTYVSHEEKTFQHDEKLPALPVPNLNDTLEKYLQSVKPLVSPEQFENTMGTVKKFKNGIGRDLQAMLLIKATIEKNWVKTWWEKYAYLSLREPLLPFYSMAGSLGLEGVPWPHNSTRLQKAALYTYYLIEFWHLLKTEHIAPTKNSDGKYFNMEQFKNFFNTSRIVGTQMDKIKSHFKPGDDCPSHVVIMCKGRLFSLDVNRGQEGRLTAPEWEQQLTWVLGACQKDGPGVAKLTTDNRSEWAKNKEWLTALSYNNQEAVQVLDSAILLIVLDETRPGSETKALQHTLGTESNNCWLDKSLSIIYYNDGTVGAVCDHAAYDGMVSITAFHYVLLSLQKCRGQWLANRQVLPSLANPCEIKFDIDSVLKLQINKVTLQTAESEWVVIVSREVFLGYGKLYTQTHKLSSDAYVQLAIQLAYYKLHARFVPVYETASTRQFYGGRTETVRSCTNESVAWIKQMMEQPRDITKCQQLLRTAVLRHNNLMKDARNGLGCDRHLFGLHCLAMEANLPLPDLFKDPSWKCSGGSGNFVLSTSLLGFTQNGGSVAPMCLDGYGCFYNILDDRIYFSISAWKNSFETSAHKLFTLLSQVLIEMQNVLGFLASKL